MNELVRLNQSYEWIICWTFISYKINGVLHINLRIHRIIRISVYRVNKLEWKINYLSHVIPIICPWFRALATVLVHRIEKKFVSDRWFGRMWKTERKRKGERKEGWSQTKTNSLSGSSIGLYLNVRQLREL